MVLQTKMKRKKWRLWSAEQKQRCANIASSSDREIGTRAKQGVIINDDNDNEKQYWFGQLGDETVHIDFEERFWYKAYGLIKEQCYHSMNSEEKIQYSCRRIKIPADGEKLKWGQQVSDAILRPREES